MQNFENLFLSDDTPWLTINCSTISKRLSINLGCMLPVSKRVKCVGMILSFLETILLYVNHITICLFADL